VRSGLSELAELARRALEEKRLKDCLALTSAILKIDPENRDAKVMEGWIRSDLRHQIQQAYGLMRSSRFTDAREPVEKAGLMLQDILDIDPGNEDAQILFSRVEAMLQGRPRAPITRTSSPQPAQINQPSPQMEDEDDEEEVERAPSRRPRYLFMILCMVLLGAGSVVFLTGVDEWRDLLGVNATVSVIPGTLAITVDEGIRIHLNDKYAGTAPIKSLNLAPGVYHLRYELDGVEVGAEDVTVVSGETVTNTTHALLGRLELLVIPATGVQVRVDGKPAIPLPEYVDVKAGRHRLTFTATGYQPQTVSASVEAGDRSMVKAILTPALPPLPPPPATSPSTNNTGAGTPVFRPNGFLAVSSPFPVEIYIDGTRVGSTPATIELPAGPHTVEYRYGGRSKTMVHVIESRQTMRASITFD
jgi:hypothetical protein